MKSICLLPLLFIAAFSSFASAGWKCDSSNAAVYESQCSTAGEQESPESFITAFVNAVRSSNTNPNRTNYSAGACTLNGTTDASCAYSWTSYGSQFNNTVGIVKTAAACPETIESRGATSAAIKSGDKYYVAWSVGSVTADICHNSCSYLASSASVSNCYLSTGSTSTGFCNFVVGVNSTSPACAAESGYTAPSTGDPLTPDPDPGDGGDGGSGGDGGDNGGGDGGDDGGSFDGELSFDAPGSLGADSVLDRESNAAKYNSMVRGFEADLNDSGFGQALADFNQKISSAGSLATCPTAQVQLLGTMITFDAHCALFDSVSSILAAVFLAAWSLLAVRVFLSA